MIREFSRPKAHMNQIFTISAIQKLKLRFSVDFVSARNIPILLQGTRLLQATIHSKIKKYNVIEEMVEMQENFLHDSLCTWRPKYCLDLFLYFGVKGPIIVGIPMLSETQPEPFQIGLRWKCVDFRGIQAQFRGQNITLMYPALATALQSRTVFSSSELHDFQLMDLRHDDYVVSTEDGIFFVPDTSSCVEIKHYVSEDNTTPTEIPECVCFAHLTCDLDENMHSTMVILVYDLVLKSNTTLDTKQRYTYLRSIQEQLELVSIGDACVRVQWAGDLSIYNTLPSLTLPHSHDRIVIYGSDKQPYEQYSFEENQE
jgi:hypothetical protein